MGSTGERAKQAPLRFTLSSVLTCICIDTQSGSTSDLLTSHISPPAHPPPRVHIFLLELEVKADAGVSAQP